MYEQHFMNSIIELNTLRILKNLNLSIHTVVLVILNETLDHHKAHESVSNKPIIMMFICW